MVLGMDWTYALTPSIVAHAQVKDALAAVAKLHNHVLQEGDGGGTTNKEKKRSKAGASSGTLLWARQVSGEGAHLKKWRLILRNLPFDVCSHPLLAPQSYCKHLFGYHVDVTLTKAAEHQTEDFESQCIIYPRYSKASLQAQSKGTWTLSLLVF